MQQTDPFYRMILKETWLISESSSSLWFFAVSRELVAYSSNAVDMSFEVFLVVEPNGVHFFLQFHDSMSFFDVWSSDRLSVSSFAVFVLSSKQLPNWDISVGKKSESYFFDISLIFQPFRMIIGIFLGLWVDIYELGS